MKGSKADPFIVVTDLELVCSKAEEVSSVSPPRSVTPDKSLLFYKTSANGAAGAYDSRRRRVRASGVVQALSMRTGEESRKAVLVMH